MKYLRATCAQALVGSVSRGPTKHFMLCGLSMHRFMKMHYSLSCVRNALCKDLEHAQGFVLFLCFCIVFDAVVDFKLLSIQRLLWPMYLLGCMEALPHARA